MNFLTNNDQALLDLINIAQNNPRGPEAQKVRAAMQAFILKPIKAYKQKIQAYKAPIQAVAVSTDFEMNLTNSFNVTLESANFDVGWEASFRDVPRDENKNFWEIGTVQNGVTFRKVQEGQRIQVDGMSGDFVNAYVDYYGGALGFTDAMIRWRQLALMVEKAELFRNSFFTNKADNHYALLAAAAATAGNTILYQGTGADTRIQRVVLTINEAAFQIGDRNKDKGFGDMANAPLIIYANPRDQEVIESAFRVTTDFLAAGQQQGTSITTRPIRRIYTYNSQITAGQPLLILPGRKIQKNDAMAPTTYTAEKDVLTLNQVQAVWAIYGAAVADTDQCFRFNLS